jgi:phage terminase large subunit
VRPRFAYLAPFLRRLGVSRGEFGATAHEGELRVDYPGGGQVRLYGADNPDAMRGIYLDGIVLDDSRPRAIAARR